MDCFLNERLAPEERDEYCITCGAMQRKGRKRLRHHLTSAIPGCSGGSSSVHSPPDRCACVGNSHPPCRRAHLAVFMQPQGCDTSSTRPCTSVMHQGQSYQHRAQCSMTPKVYPWLIDDIPICKYSGVLSGSNKHVMCPEGGTVLGQSRCLLL